MDNYKIRHFGNSFYLNVDKLPSKAVDRHSVVSAVVFLLLGLLLASVGVYEFFNGIRPSALEVEKFMSAQNTHMLLMSPTLFDVVIFLLGAGIVISMALAIMRYKKINFDGDFIRIIIRPAIGEKVRITEPVYAYEEVRLRTEFLQFGLINRTKYIIELVHRDDRKTVPLYISTSKKNVRKMLEHYARTLRKPASMYTEYGYSVRNCDDLDVPLKELIQSGKFPKPHAPDGACPKSIIIVNRAKNLVIKIKDVLFDAYNAIAVLFLIAFSGGIFMAAYNHEFLSEYFASDMLLLFYVISFLFVIYSIILLIQRDKLIIKPDKVVLMHKFLLLSLKAGEIYKDKIEEVEMICNPASGRSYISLISDDKSLIFAKKLPLADLRWLRQYIIAELIK